MRTLAIEFSTETGSLALMEQGRPIVEKEWPGEIRQRRPIFADLHALVHSGSLDFSIVDQIAVGVGPGAFSGLRMAVSLAQGLSIPYQTPVTGVSSARALAWAVLKETRAGQVVVWGDARRNELWAGCFGVEDGIVRLKGDWIVTLADQMPESLMTAGVWVTADWLRIGSILEARCPSGVTLMREPRQPGARMVAQVAEELAARRLEGEPLVPIYVHPAVSIPPKF